MVGSGGAPPPMKWPPAPSEAGWASGATPPGQGNGRGALPPGQGNGRGTLPASESGAGRGGVPLPKAAAGRGSGGPDAARYADGAPMGRPPAPVGRAWWTGLRSSAGGSRRCCGRSCGPGGRLDRLLHPTSLLARLRRRSPTVLWLCPGVSGGMTATMPTGLASIVVLRPRVAGVAMHGKAMARLRGRSWVLPVASLRGLRIRVIGSEEGTVAIVVVGAVEGAGTVHVLRPHLLLSSR
nr:uncharacterized protein LOC123497549 [Aegilops tauschii subsp. strangulata]